MTHSSDDKNYVRAVLSYLGIDFDEADIVLSVCHCQSEPPRVSWRVFYL